MKAKPKKGGAGSSQAKRHWGIAISAGIGVHAVGLALFSVDPTPERQLLVERAYLTMTHGGSEAVRGLGFDRVALLDTAPLYLPSRWNTTDGDLERIRGRQPEELFDLYPPRLSFGDSPAAAELSLRLETAGDPRELLLQADRAPFASMGRRDREPPSTAVRFARVEVRRFGAGQPVRRFDVSSDTVGEHLDETVYSGVPMAFTLQIGRAGEAGSAFLLESSESDAIDAYFQQNLGDLLQDEFRRNGGLKGGYYRVDIGP